jgi:hypothetical protein
MMRMLEGERYKANEIYNDFKFIIGKIEDIAKNNSAYLSNIYSIFSLFKQKRLMGVVDLSQRGYQGCGRPYPTVSNCVRQDITRI